MQDLAAGMCRWLRDNLQPDGRIRDPVLGDCGTYAGGMAALAFALMHRLEPGAGWDRTSEIALRAAEKRPRDSEFDQMARLLLHPGDTSVLLYRGSRLVSNNWIAMRALNHSLRGDLKEAAELWRRVEGWQLADGLFVDSPRGEATPVTYHAKVSAVMTLAPERPPMLEAALEALCDLVSPGGVLVPYGRSRNTLFGQAAAILALSRNPVLRHRQAAADLVRRLRSWQRPDGHVPCVLNNGEAARTDWDVYVNNPDYNAYAAALLLLSDTCGLAARAPDEGPAFVSRGPIAVWRDGRRFVALCTAGQSAPWGSPFFCDYRYYGMQPLYLEQDGHAALGPASYRWPADGSRASLGDPASNPWLPYVEWQGRHYGVRRYDRVDVQGGAQGLEVVAEGVLEAYHEVPRSRRALHRLSGGEAAVPVFRVERLEGAKLRRRLLWDAGRGVLEARTELSGQPQKALLHPGTEGFSMERR